MKHGPRSDDGQSCEDGPRGGVEADRDGGATSEDRGAVMAELRRRGFRSSRRRGQNFLFDRQLLEAFVADAGVQPGDVVLEVGAGAGTLTRVLLDHGCSVLTVEIDHLLNRYLVDTFCPSLVISDSDDPGTGTIAPIGLESTDRESSARESARAKESSSARLALYCGDALASKNRLAEELESAWAAWAVRHSREPSGRCWLISNLPYSVATPILQLVAALESPSIVGAGVLVQSEVADRWAAEPGGPDYGAISVWLQLQGSGSVSRKVKPQLFSPPPQVDSSFYVWRRDHARCTPVEARAAHLVARALFLQRRKMIRVFLREAWTEMDPAWGEWGISPESRPADISPEGYLTLARALSGAPIMCKKLGFLPLGNL